MLDFGIAKVSGPRRGRPAPDADRDDLRDAGVHVARTGAGTAGRSPRRHLRRRLHHVPHADRARAVHRRQLHGHPDQAHAGAGDPAAAAPPRSGHPGGHRGGRDARRAERAQRPLGGHERVLPGAGRGGRSARPPAPGCCPRGLWGVGGHRARACACACAGANAGGLRLPNAAPPVAASPAPAKPIAGRRPWSRPLRPSRAEGQAGRAVPTAARRAPRSRRPIRPTGRSPCRGGHDPAELKKFPGL